ncbi:hypothetical protein Hte_005713 [Hypoxylon texense]
MSSNQDKDIERRRRQNRLAQRRFRERHNGQNKAMLLQPLSLKISDTSFFGELAAPDSQSLDLLSLSDDVAFSDIDYISQDHTHTNQGPDSSEIPPDTSGLGELTTSECHTLELFHSANDVALLSGIGNTQTNPRPEEVEILASPSQNHLNEGTPGCASTSTRPPRDSISGSSSGKDEGESLDLKDPGWRSPLHIAAHRGHDQIVKLLVRHGQDCNQKDSDGTTPLIHAVIGGYEDVVSTLLQHAARVSETDTYGRSSIHWAVIHQRKAILAMLLENCHGLNAAVNAYDDHGQTPLHIAIYLGLEEEVQILLRYGADLCLRARRID